MRTERLTRRQFMVAVGGVLAAIKATGTGCADQRSVDPAALERMRLGTIVDPETEAVAASFLDFAQTIISSNPSDAEAVMNAFAEWIRRTPVKHVADEFQDSVMIEWGATQFLDIDTPRDIRGLRDHELAFREKRELFIGLTRQVNPPGGDFDTDAVGMFLQLSFGEDHGDQPPSGYVYVPRAMNLRGAVADLDEEPDLARILRARIVRIQALIGHIG